MIVFNIFALLQALLVGAIIGIYYLLGIDNFEGGNGIWKMYIIHFVVAFSYKSGMKGTLFYVIPTWVVSLVAVLVTIAGYTDPEGMNESLFTAIKVASYTFAFILAYRMVFGLNSDFVKEFRQAGFVLSNIDTSEQYFLENKRKFWAQVSHTYVNPHRLFLFTYPLYKLIYRRSGITKEEFVKHYDLLTDLIHDRFSIPSNKSKITSFSRQIDRYLKTGKYSHTPNSLKNLSKAIALEYKATA